MALFHYQAFDDSGAVVAGEIEAASMAQVESALWERGLTPFETKPAQNSASPSFNFLRFQRRKKINLSELTSFTREFATLEDADLPLDDGLRILADQASHAALQEIVSDLLAMVLDGRHLSEALRKYPDVFSEEYINVVQAGEASGALAQSLSELANLLERRLEIQGKMRSALVYPAILVVMAVASVGVVVSVLVPSVAPIFADSGRPMPAGLALIMSAQDHWIEIAGFFFCLVVAIFFLLRLARRNIGVKLSLARYRLRAPFIGTLTAKQEIARFAHTLGSLIRAGVPLLMALDCARQVVRNAVMARDFEHVIEDVRNGTPLADALRTVTAIPSLALRMVRVGEETGKTGPMLVRLAAMFDTQNQRVVDRLMSALTPILTILIASLVGGLVMSVMTAILSINELATQ